jgi:hypothetical protein
MENDFREFSKISDFVAKETRLRRQVMDGRVNDSPPCRGPMPGHQRDTRFTLTVEIGNGSLCKAWCAGSQLTTKRVAARGRRRGGVIPGRQSA